MDDRLALTDHVSASSCRRGGLAPWQVRRLLRHITDHLDTPTRVADLAAVARLSVSHFAHAFRISFEVSPATLVRLYRVERARNMVLASRLPLAEIALACGFADQAHMSRLFRRHLDLPPARWRASVAGDGQHQRLQLRANPTAHASFAAASA